MIDPDAGMEFLSFVRSRHEAWFGRSRGLSAPWTHNPIVSTRKFTNVFRILDHGTQFIMTDLVEDGISDRDLLMRLFLYRHTGRVEVWRDAFLRVGEYPTVGNLEDTLEAFKAYRDEASAPVFTSAYLVYPQSHTKGTDKLDSIFELTSRLFLDYRPGNVADDFISADNQSDRFACLRRNKGVADFMSMQILTDWGYTPSCGEDRENEFIVAGPGARKGAAELDPSAKAEDVVHWAYNSIRENLIWVALDNGRKPSYMDAQNCLCEFSKYVRYALKPAPAKPYTPAHPGPQNPPVLPSHW